MCNIKLWTAPSTTTDCWQDLRLISLSFLIDVTLTYIYGIFPSQTPLTEASRLNHSIHCNCTMWICNKAIIIYIEATNTMSISIALIHIQFLFASDSTDPNINWKNDIADRRLSVVRALFGTYLSDLCPRRPIHRLSSNSCDVRSYNGVDRHCPVVCSNILRHRALRCIGAIHSRLIQFGINSSIHHC